MNIEKIRQLIKLVEESKINELEIITFFGKKIRIRKYNEEEVENHRVQVVPVAEQKVEEIKKAVQVEIKKEEEVKEENLYEVKSPLVGTFYRAPRPDAPPFVKEGDHIKAGQVLCLIEAMKIFNEIKSEVSGIVRKIMVENGAPVQYGEVLFLIEIE